jgi:hypothetical protein
VRINRIVNASTSDPGWVNISVPSQAGNGNGQNPGDIQIDLLHSQTAATFFNTGGAVPGTYSTVQVLVDVNNPGLIVPACASAGTGDEGCTQYPMVFTTTDQAVLFTLGAPMVLTANQTAPLVINLAVSIDFPPATTSKPYSVTVTPTEVNASSYLAAVTGTITTKGTLKALAFAPQTVYAELSGTNTVIESVPLKAKRIYTLELPAALEGTAYDIFVAGGGATYAALKGFTVVPGQGITDANMTTIASTAGKFDGVVADACTGAGIPGAQLEILAPAATPTPPTPLPSETATPKPTPPTPVPTPTGLFCLDYPNRCVAVGNATADSSGDYPLEGTTRNPSPFDDVPIGQTDLALQVSASGYNTLISSAIARMESEADCSASTSTVQCSFSLDTGYVTGNVSLVMDPPPENSTFVQVFAENSGTNDLVSALDQPLVFVNNQNSEPFTLNVPIGTQPLDLFAVAIDPFDGGPDPFPGHNIPVLGNQPAPSTACQTTTAAPFLPMDCVGHGSISGTVQDPDLGTSVEVEKLDPNNVPVQILGTSPGLFSSNPPMNNAYTLCVPPDNYVLQRFELPPSTPGASPSSTPTPVGAAQDIMVPAPASTSSPCPSSCSNSDIASFPCPGLCAATSANPL